MIGMWLERAESGDPAAQFQLGWCHEMGQGTPVDLEAACQWYRRAAAQGYPRAQYHLGLACSYGAPGVAWDLAEACKWLMLAARNHLAEAGPVLEALKTTPEQRARGEKMAREFVAVSEPRPSVIPSRGEHEALGRDAPPPSQETQLALPFA
jgi:uncharacterized protein